MDKALVERIRIAAHSSEEPKTRLIEALMEIDPASTEILEALGPLMAGSTKVEDGLPMRVGDTADEATIVIGLGQLVELLEAVKRPQSFREALEQTGFVPASNAKPGARRGHPRNPLHQSTAEWQ